MTLFAVLPVKNEADRFLREVLTHVLGITDRVFVYDDRSDDETPEVAAGLGAHVWIRPPDVPGFVEHEGQFRQWGWESFEHEMKPTPGDWVLSLDADEKLYGTEFLNQLLEQRTYDVVGVSFLHMWNETQYRVDKAWAPNVSFRLFRYQPGGKFKDRKLASGAEPTYVRQLIDAGKLMKHSPLVMQHLGYSRDVDKKMKYERYMELDGGEYHSLAHLKSILDPSPVLVPWTR